LIPRTSAATIRIESIPPRLSTGSVVSFTWAGISRTAAWRATSASGSVIRKHEPQSNCSKSAPETIGPSADSAPPIADQSAIAFVRSGPDQSAVISASVVGNAIPAARPPSTRAPNSTSTDGASPAISDAGIVTAMPSTTISLRPWRSPSAPR
jgi:hypothetical protein